MFTVGGELKLTARYGDHYAKVDAGRGLMLGLRPHRDHADLVTWMHMK